MSRALSAADSSAALSTGAPAKASSALLHMSNRLIQVTSHIMQAIAGMNAHFRITTGVGRGRNWISEMEKADRGPRAVQAVVDII